MHMRRRWNVEKEASGFLLSFLLVSGEGARFWSLWKAQLELTCSRERWKVPRLLTQSLPMPQSFSGKSNRLLLAPATIPVTSRLLDGVAGVEGLAYLKVCSSTVTLANSEASCPSTPGRGDGSAALTERWRPPPRSAPASVNTNGLKSLYNESTICKGMRRETQLTCLCMNMT